MEMEVVDGLPAVTPHVGDDPIAAFGDPLCAGELRNILEDSGEEIAVARSQIVGGGDVSPRQQKDVCRRLRVDVTDGDDQVVLVDPRRGQLARDDAAEEAPGLRLRLRLRVGYHSFGFALIRNPIVPTRPAIAYDT
jgi:hypothetical protein